MLPLNQCKTPDAKALDLALRNPEGSWIMEPKMDGWRIQMEIEHGKSPVAWTRTGHEATGKLKMPELELNTFLAAIPLKRTVLDGEVVYIRPSGVPDFQHTSSAMGSGLGVCLEKQYERGYLSYVLFDVLWFDGEDIRNQSWSTRRAALESLWWWKGFEYTKLMTYTEPSVERHQLNIELWGEGSILKQVHAPYEGKRTKWWLKWKNQPDEDVVIMGFKPGEGKFEGQIGAVQFGQRLPSGMFEVRGYCSGMDDATRLWITEHQSELRGRVLTIKTFGILANGGFRHPQWLRLREDKSPEECEWT